MAETTPENEPSTSASSEETSLTEEIVEYPIDKSETANRHKGYQSPGWLAPAALVIAVVAVLLAGWALLKPVSGAPDVEAGFANSKQGDGDAKTVACDAYSTVSAAVSKQTHAEVGNDPASIEAVAANSRLAMAGGAQYLLTRTTADTPAELANAIGEFAGSLQNIAINALAGIPNTDPIQAEQLSTAEESNRKIAELCQ